MNPPNPKRFRCSGNEAQAEGGKEERRGARVDVVGDGLTPT